MKFKAGDIVKIKEGVTIKDMNLPIAGWHGRVIEYEEDDLILLELDSVVLKSFPKDYILQAIRETGIQQFNHFYMEEKDLERSEARDTPSDVEQALKYIENEYFWEAEGHGDPCYDIIQEVLKDVEEGDENEAWEDYLEKHLKFPFKVKVTHSERGAALREGTILIVKSLDEFYEDYGWLVNVKIEGERGSYQIPLTDIEVVDDKSPNFLVVDAYGAWFVNYYE